MTKKYLLTLILVLALAMAGCSGSGGGTTASKDNGGNQGGVLTPIIVGSLLDAPLRKAAPLTLRAALAQAKSNQVIQFDPSLDGGVISLSVVGDGSTMLHGEVMGMREEESGWVSYLVGYLERDYGPSALYAAKDVVLDASALPNGITLEWTGGLANPARVLAVLGNLTMNNVTVTGGRSVTEDISATNPDQPWTLARGGGSGCVGSCQSYQLYSV